MTKPSSSPDALAKWMALAKQEPVPAVNVVGPVLQRIARSRPTAATSTDRLVIWGACASTVVAASLLAAMWTATRLLIDPATATVRPVSVAMVEGM